MQQSAANKTIVHDGGCLSVKFWFEHLPHFSGGAMFSNVSISLPAKVRGPEAEEEWQEVDWVTWSTGSVTVDAQSFIIMFKPSGGGSVKAKTLGNLVRAAGVGAQDDEEVTTVIVTTSESLHKTFRCTFQTGEDADAFLDLAKQAEEAYEAANKYKESEDFDDGQAARLESSIRAKLAERWPLVYTGAELYGPDPNGEITSEVLLGRGAMVLLDSEVKNKVGNYELLFYCEDEDASKPSRSFSISPEMSLARQEDTDEDEEGPAVSFILKGPTMAAHSLCFEDKLTAGHFARDFRVRSKLMDMSLKTVRGRAAAQDLRKDIESLKQRSLAARAWTVTRYTLLLAFLLAVARTGQLYMQDSGRQPAEYIQVIGSDLWHAVVLFVSTSTAIGAKACEVTFGTVAGADLRQCTRETSVPAMKRCIDSLLSYPILGEL
ncbi:unnamed protein product [Effrenium voratum]|nr:unnamed protein product [Effrenium voratum]